MSLSGANVVVTGGAGFIGSELVRQLVAAGARVCVLDNLVNGSERHLEGIEMTRAKPILLRGDVRDAALLREVLRDRDVVFHLACLGVRHSLAHPLENHDVNATGTLRVLEAAQAAGVRRVVHVSSSEVYGTARFTPMTEEHPTRPSTVYGASKLAGESYARAFHATHGLPVVIARPFNAHGPRSHHAGDAGEVIPRFIVNLLAGRPLTIFGDGLQTRDFTFVSDTAEALIAMAGAKGIEGRTIHVGSGREISMIDLGTMIADIMGVRAEFRLEPGRPGDVRRLVADSTRAREALGWEARTSLESGLRQTVDWFRGMRD